MQKNTGGSLSPLTLSSPSLASSHPPAAGGIAGSLAPLSHHFTAAACERLGVAAPPEWLNSLAQTAVSGASMFGMLSCVARFRPRRRRRRSSKEPPRAQSGASSAAATTGGAAAAPCGPHGFGVHEAPLSPPGHKRYASTGSEAAADRESSPSAVQHRRRATDCNAEPRGLLEPTGSGTTCARAIEINFDDDGTEYDADGEYGLREA